MDRRAVNFGVNLSHHGLLLTEKDCNLINKNIFKNELDIQKINTSVNVDINMKKRAIKIENNTGINSNENAGLLIGFVALPDRNGFEYVLDHCEESGREKNKTIFTRAQNMIGKKMYFYIFDLNRKDWPNDSFLNRYLNSYSSKIHGGEDGIFGKIFGEGIIDEVIQKKDGKYIIYKYVTHYREYIDIDKVTKLSDRIHEMNKNKPMVSQKSVRQRIHLVLSLTKEECDQISELAGIT